MTQKVFIFLSVILVLFCCCSSNDESPVQKPEGEQENEQVKNFSFLALGDSYTIGQGVEQDQSWPFQLKSSTQASKKRIETLTVIARTGWTTGNLLNAIDEQSPSNHDLVSLLIGVNNQYQRGSFSKFQEEFNTLLDIAIDLAQSNKKVMVISIPDYGVTPFGASNSQTIAEELDTYNAYIKQQCVATEVVFVDVTTISRNLGASENALASDNLHPSGYQYNLWVEKMLPVVEEILK
ncbi:SGNH/GDSL hydrolase family protein [Aquimarina gracilis]|uniref:SGNH/GDSL hydrolase family protein n=1 Tax=Aquimarina gracilis TaxID=874422 RepID=A0ABU6A0L1_9FLAO|nr:SGNH/GDSL hydrolase family protein [Aquimarina gracilis]MEB3347695.1 SGNH/GDSL hydrolase family protein [Aquimarina gracilis]